MDINAAATLLPGGVSDSTMVPQGVTNVVDAYRQLFPPKSTDLKFGVAIWAFSLHFTHPLSYPLLPIMLSMGEYFRCCSDIWVVVK
jgi:hypothetical protein